MELKAALAALLTSSLLLSPRTVQPWSMSATTARRQVSLPCVLLAIAASEPNGDQNTNTSGKCNEKALDALK